MNETANKVTQFVEHLTPHHTSVGSNPGATRHKEKMVWIELMILWLTAGITSYVQDLKLPKRMFHYLTQAKLL